MQNETSFDTLWCNLAKFEWPPEASKGEPTVELPICGYALKFSEWVNALCAEVIQHPTLVSVNQTKLLLLDKYFEWRSVVPRIHGKRIGPQGHRCIFQVFVQAYENLRAVELSLTPPMLFKPPRHRVLPPPPPPPVPQIAGIFMGELEKL